MANERIGGGGVGGQRPTVWRGPLRPRSLALSVLAVALVGVVLGCTIATGPAQGGKGGSIVGGDRKSVLPASVANGKQLYQQNCNSCHGTPGDRLPVAPLFAKEFLESRGDATLMMVIAEGKGAMPAWGKVRGGPLNDSEVQNLVAFLNYSAGRESSSVRAGKGRDSYASSCVSCHGEKGDRVPVAPLNVKGFLDSRSDEDLANAIAEGKGLMPARGRAKGGDLTDEQVSSVVDYLRNTVEANVATSASRGREFYLSRCLTCHGERGERISGVSLASFEFLNSRGDGALVSAISDGKGTMPAFGRGKGGAYEPTEIAAILAYLKAWSGTNASSALTGAAPGGEGKDLFTMSCAPCHGQAGDKVAGVKLRSKSFLQQRGEARLTQTISQGNAKGMPAWARSSGGPLSDEQINGLVRYLQSTAVDAETSAPPAGTSASPALSEKKDGAAAPASSGQAGAGTSPGPSAQTNAATAAAAGAPSSAGAIDASLVAKGKELFAKTCVTCHGESRDRIPTCKLADRTWVEQKGEAGLIQSIANGKGGMPAWSTAKGGSLSDTDIKALAAFLLSAVGAGPNAAAQSSGGTSAAGQSSAETLASKARVTSSLSARGGTSPVARESSASRLSAGKDLFTRYCQACHGADGRGQPNCPLGSKEWLQNMSQEGLAARIKNGKPSAGMPAWGKGNGGPLEDADVTAIMMYLGEMAR
ncbi:MAG: c-type cytochrome [Chloroflexi bacterium]|nr:c-type cytochrome [Chloroflexota bacterium]